MPLGSKTRTYIAHAIVPVIRDNLVYANVIPCLLYIRNLSNPLWMQKHGLYPVTADSFRFLTLLLCQRGV